jgi:CRP-like cAMP-binding protein
MRYYARKVKRFNRGDVIFSENSECDGMYIVDKGRVRVYKTVVTNTGTQELELVQLGPKSMFGEMAMIDESKRSASVQALEPTECTVITKQIFEDQLSHIPTWMVNMIRILVQRLRDTNEKLRVHMEAQKTPMPDDDPGSLITVNPEEKDDFFSPSARPLARGKRSITREQLAKVLPEEIINDLFTD